MQRGHAKFLANSQPKITSMKNRLVSCFRAALLVCALPLAALAQFSVPATADTFISKNDPGVAPGASTLLSSIQVENGDYQNFTFIKFDLTSFAGQTVTGNGTLSLRLVSSYGPGLPLAGDNFQLKALASAFDEATTNYINYGFNVGDTYQGPAIINSLANIGGAQSYDFTGATLPVTLNFLVPAATLQSWIDAPAGNFGLAITRNYDSSGFRQDNVNLDFASIESGFAPEISFNTSASAIPEPSTYAAIAGALTMGVAVLRRRQQAKAAAVAPSAAA